MVRILTTIDQIVSKVCDITNNMRHHFEAVESKLIENEPYKRSQKRLAAPGSQDNIYGINFSGGRVSSRVYLR